MSDWYSRPLGDLITLQRGFDITRDQQARDGAVPVVSSGGISSYHDTAMAIGPGVVIGRKGTLGRVHFVDVPYWPHDTTLWVKDFKGNDPRFVYYALMMLDTEFLNVGSASPTLNRNHLHPLPVSWPSLPEQKAIAEVLGALDDKIAANLRIAAIADELVRAWYTSWAARAPGAMPLSALAEHHRVAVDPASMPPTTPYVGLEHLPRRSMWLPDSAVASGVTSGKSVFSEGDVLFGKLRPYFHKVVGAAADGICSTDILVIRANDPDLRGLVLAAAASDEAVALATASSEGTRMPRTNWKDLATLAVPWHDEASARALSADVRGMWAMTSSKFIENARLASLRDALLPLLVSGKVRVKDAEKVVEGVV